MTQDELAAQIEKEIERKGGANVPLGVIREAFADEARNSTTLEDALEEFASIHAWQVRHDDLHTPRFYFYPVESAGKLSEEQEE